MVRNILALCALLSFGALVFAQSGTTLIPPIWSVMLLVIISAFVFALIMGVRELSALSNVMRNFLTGLILVLWMYVVYYFS